MQQPHSDSRDSNTAAPAPFDAGALLSRALFEQSPFSTVLYDADGHLVAVNEAFRRFWGVGVDTAPPDYCVFDDEQLEQQGALAFIRRAFDGETVVTPPVRYDISKISTTGEGREAWTEAYVYPVHDADGALSNVVLVHVDITERMRAHNSAVEAQRSAEHSAERTRRLQSLTAAMSRALTLDDVARVIVEQGLLAANAQAGLVLLLSEDGQRLHAHFASGYPEITLDALRDVPVTSNFPLRDAARGQPVFLSSLTEWTSRYDPPVWPNPMAQAAAILPLAGGTMRMGVLAMRFQDVHRFDEEERDFLQSLAHQGGQALERAHLFSAERAARAEAERANRAKMDFLATMSHELRTPLNAIGGYAELLSMGVRGPVNAAQLTDLERIQRSQQHLLSLINDVLNFAKLEAGKVEVRLEPVYVRDLLLGLEPLLAPQMEAKHLAFVSRAVDPALSVIADADKVRQVMLNLLSNAMKFTPDGGRITLFCEEDAAEVRLCVRDTGIGIASEFLERIFDPFVQLERRLTNVVAGTGLGLAISRDLARAMNGEVSVESRPNAGSTFRVHLKRADGRTGG